MKSKNNPTNKEKESPVMGECLICKHELKGTWYSYNIKMTEVELCESCECILRMKILRQCADEELCKETIRNVRE